MIESGMMEFTQRFWEVFFEVYEALPRQGPGARECTARAFALCRDLPAVPAILDMGCGVGAQTIHLAGLSGGTIDAIDIHVPAIKRLRRTVVEHGLSRRVRPVAGNMAEPPYAPASFDLIWSEGALYNIGIENGLRICRSLLRPGGHVAFTDAVWRKENPPGEVRAIFAQDYPRMGWAADVLTTIQRCGFEVIGHFTLPDQAWWGEFYTPMEERVALLRPKHEKDQDASRALDLIGGEIEMHRKYSDFYAYEFFVMRRRN